MKKDINYIWGEICSYFSNGKNYTEKSTINENIEYSEHKELFEIIKKDMERVEQTAYMYDDETNKAWDDFKNKTQILNKPESKIRLINYVQLFRVAAIFIIAIGLSWYAFDKINHRSLNIETMAFQSVETLPDGTKVYLNANSKISYPKNFRSKKREVSLSGEAYFDVVKNPDKPFIINANDAQIKVLGTTFNVLTKQSDNVEVLVETGIVSLSSSKIQDEIILKKGESAILENLSIKRLMINDENYLSWKTKVIRFNEAPLPYVINVLNKAYISNINLDSTVPNNLQLNAKFDNIELDKVLESVCLALDLKYTEDNGEIFLTNNTN